MHKMVETYSVQLNFGSYSRNVKVKEALQFPLELFSLGDGMRRVVLFRLSAQKHPTISRHGRSALWTQATFSDDIVCLTNGSALARLPCVLRSPLAFGQY